MIDMHFDLCAKSAQRVGHNVATDLIVEKEGDVGLLRRKTLDQLYLNWIEILRLVNQDVSRAYGRTLLRLKLFESKKKEIIVVKS